MERELEQTCMFTGERFETAWTSKKRISPFESTEIHRSVIQEHLPTVLAQFATTSTIAWVRTLSDMVEDAATVLTTSHVWKNQFGIVLEMTPESEMWMADFQIRG